MAELDRENAMQYYSLVEHAVNEQIQFMKQTLAKVLDANVEVSPDPQHPDAIGAALAAQKLDND